MNYMNVCLSDVLKSKGIKAKALAQHLGMTEANLSRFRSGKTKYISFEVLGKMCDYLGCKPGDILQFEE